MKYNLPKPYLSASAINTYLRCGMQFKFRYVDGIIMPPNINMLVGSAGHAGHEHYYRDILDGCSERMTPEMVAELTQVLLEEDAREQGCPLEGEIKDTAMQEVGIATKSYIENVGAYTDPVAVEEEIRYITRCGVEILGYIDLFRGPNAYEKELNAQVSSEAEKTDAVIVDYKFTGKKMNLAQVKGSLQFHLYALATDVFDVEVQNIVKTTKKIKSLPDKGTPADAVQDKTSNLRLLRHRYTPQEFDHVENLVESVAGAISAGVFTPCAMDAWNCSPDWCGYWGLCRGRGLGTQKIIDMATA